MLKEVLGKGEFVAAPGVHDMITAMIANKIGFDFVFASGYWTIASAYGLPDAGLATYTQMLERVSTLVQSSNAGIIADADTGYGGLLNVHHTVRGYEQAGVQAIQLEDQEFPKQCGHTGTKQVIPLNDMVQKIEVACEARTSPDTLIIGRTDAKQPEGYERALERAIAYAEAGADIILFEALETQDEMSAACKAVKKPMMLNMANGGKTPDMTVDEIKAAGFSLAIFPSTAPLAAAYAVETALRTLKLEGSSTTPDAPHFSFPEFGELIGFPDIHAFDRKWADRKDKT